MEKYLWIILSVMTPVMVYLAILVGEFAPSVATTALLITLVPIFIAALAVDRIN